MEKTSLIELLQRAKTKKISFDINERTLNMVDELAKIQGLSRSKILDILLFAGVEAHINSIIEEWNRMKKDGLKDLVHKENEKGIEEVIKKIDKFRKKWAIDRL